MSPSILASEVDQAIQGQLDKDTILHHVREYLTDEIAKQPLFGEPLISRFSPMAEEFDKWWSSLPKEMKLGKQDAVKAFNQMKMALPPIDSLINITTQQADIRRRTGQGFLHPATFLRKRRWEDSLDSLRAWGGRKSGSLFDFTEDERSALDNDTRFALG